MSISWADHGHPNPLGAFRKAFPETVPARYSRAPGRVNLIGEHTDYNGLPVLPMALQREVRVLFSPRDDALVRVANVDGEFGRREFALSSDIPPDPPGDWANYLKAPCQALARRFGPRSESLNGFDALVSSNLPVASGLSSSSALVIALGQVVLDVNELHLSTLEFAEEMARAERYTGTQGGGMDQAISAGAKAGCASRIEFNPLRMFETAVPSDWRFLVAHTLVRAEKSGPAQEAYNSRTRECREALNMIGRVLSESGNLVPRMREAGQLDEVPVDPGQMDGVLAKHGLGEDSFSYPELLARICIQDLVDLGEEHLHGNLLKRFRHVVTEGTRVYDAEHALGREDRMTFGLLMNGSHGSLRDDYEVSSPELDRLVELALGAGANGARLTGAGFGGCIVALVGTERVDDVLSALEKGHYEKRELTQPLDQVLFVAEASKGASIVEF